ncbi:MAG: hypothetical protein O7D96_05655, partial [SAR324 cluster bacterium]|nr:hypothetical protein [SAR324 cluster bacterium]
MEVPRYALVQVEREIRFGWVAEHLGRRRRIVLEDGSERVEAAKRILYEWEGEPVESEGSPAGHRAAEDRAAGDRGSGAAQDQLREQARRAKQPPAGFDGIALHARLKPGQSLDFATLAALVLGEAARGWARAGLYYALLGASGLFRRSREGFAARSGVELKQQAERAAALRSHQDGLEQVGAWLQALEAGNWSPGTGPEAAEFLSQLESLVAFEGRSPHWKALVQPLELPAHDWEENRVKLKRWLEAAGAWKGWSAVWLLGSGVTEGFAPELEARARVLAGRP